MRRCPTSAWWTIRPIIIRARPAFIIKTVADKKTRKLLGVQVLGSGAVDKVTDVAVTAVTMGATVDQLANLDLAYAPPFSTAIHPLVTAIGILTNKMDGILDSFTPAEFAAGAAEGYRVIDTSPGSCDFRRALCGRYPGKWARRGVGKG